MGTAEEDAPPARRQRITPATGPSKTSIWDLGGAGDCGYRCVAAQVARANNKLEKDIEAKMATLANAMRRKMVAHLTKHTKWKDTWQNDPEDNALTLSGPEVSTAAEWLQAVRERTGMWMSWIQLQAAAAVTKSHIIVFEWQGDAWVITARFGESKHAMLPVVLLG